MTKPQAQTKPIRFIQAGRLRTLHDVPPERTVLEVLREDLHQTGTKAVSYTHLTLPTKRIV